MANLQHVEAQVLIEINRAEKITKQSLAGWKFTFNRTKRSLGRCNYTKKLIEISKYHAQARTLEDITMTIRHEIAHALCGPFEGHSTVWQEVCRRIGGNGERYKAHDDALPPAWVIVYDGEIVHRLYRKPSADYSTRMLKGRPDTLGKLIPMPYETYVAKYGETL